MQKNAPIKTVDSHHGRSFEFIVSPTLHVSIVPKTLYDEIRAVQPNLPKLRTAHLEFSVSVDDDPNFKRIFITPLRTFQMREFNCNLLWNLRTEVNRNLNGLASVGSSEIKDLLINIADCLIKVSNPVAISPSLNLKQAFHENSHIEICNFVQLLHLGKLQYDPESYMSKGSSAPDYSHIAHFGYIYYRQLQRVRELDDESKNPITIYDIGCGAGPFVSAAIEHFKTFPTKRPLVFVGIDLDESKISIAKEICAHSLVGAENISAAFECHDIESHRFLDYLLATRPDLIVVNHLLEHLIGTKGKAGLENRFLHPFILAARFGVSISLPFEEAPETAICQHRAVFDFEAILKLGKMMITRCAGALEAGDLETTSKAGLILWKKRAQAGFVGQSFRIVPETIYAIAASDVYEDFKKPFNLESFKRSRRSPKIGQIQNKADFLAPGKVTQVRQLVIKIPRSDILVPDELVCVKEAVQIAADHNKTVNPDYENTYCYLNLFQGMTKVDAYRGLSLTQHGDQLQGLDPAFWYKPDYSYIVSSTLPTILFEQEFDLTEAMQRKAAGDHVDLYSYFREQANRKNVYRSENFGMYLLSPYIIHSAAPAEVEEYRVFVKIAFSSKRFFDSRELRSNPVFPIDSWLGKPTLSQFSQWLHHGHYNEFYLAEDIITQKP